MFSHHRVWKLILIRVALNNQAHIWLRLESKEKGKADCKDTLNHTGILKNFLSLLILHLSRTHMLLQQKEKGNGGKVN